MKKHKEGTNSEQTVALATEIEFPLETVVKWHTQLHARGTR
jgi:hypothetical protein